MEVLNFTAYETLFSIETLLREFIIESLTESIGPKWYKQLSNDLLDKYKAAQKIETSSYWKSHICHHPIYYLDFPDLHKIIIRRDNWRNVFSATFHKEEVISGHLVSLEPIRNKIAHNRLISKFDLAEINHCHQYLQTQIGEEKVKKLIKNLTIAEEIYSKLCSLKFEFTQIKSSILYCAMVDNLPTISQMVQSWWFDTEYLGFDISEIIGFCDQTNDYNNLPRFQGCGYKIQNWVKKSNYLENCDRALEILDEIFDQ
jgi:hypothetical protein